MWRRNVNFIKRFIEEVSSEIAITEYAKRNPRRMNEFVRAVRTSGYPAVETEEEDILLEQFSRLYGIPRYRSNGFGKRDYRR